MLDRVKDLERTAMVPCDQSDELHILFDGVLNVDDGDLSVADKFRKGLRDHLQHLTNLSNLQHMLK